MKCLCCGKTINQNAAESEKKWQWHKKCVVNFFHTKEMPVLDITKEQLEFLVNETVNEGLTVPGVQKKLSLHLSSDIDARLTIVDYPTGYILKPQKNLKICRNLKILPCDLLRSWGYRQCHMHL